MAAALATGRFPLLALASLSSSKGRNLDYRSDEAPSICAGLLGRDLGLCTGVFMLAQAGVLTNRLAPARGPPASIAACPQRLCRRDGALSSDQKLQFRPAISRVRERVEPR